MRLLSRRLSKKIAFCVILSLNLAVSALAEETADDRVHGPSDRFINFGVVVHNDNYTLYRSSSLDKIGIKHLSKILNKQDLPFPKTIIYMNKQGYSFPLYFALSEYEASLSGKYGEFEFFHPFGEMRTYVDGGNPYHPTEDIDTDSILGHRARRYFELQDDGIDGGVDTVVNILNVILDPNRQPVLFHCYGGLHRTGMLAMSLRYIQGGYWIDGPKTEARGMKLNPAQYEYYKFNPVLFRKDNIEFVEEFSRDSRFLKLKAIYQDTLSSDSQIFFGDDEANEKPSQVQLLND